MINSSIVLSSFLRAFALGLFLLFLATAVPPAVLQSGGRVLWAILRAREGPLEARQRFLGKPWTQAIDEIRREIPRDGEYLLVCGQASEDTYWVRFELAPRRALFPGCWSRLPRNAAWLRNPAAVPPWVVVAFEEPRPPILLTREGFLRRLDRAQGPF